MKPQKPKKFYTDEYLDGYEYGAGRELEIDPADISDDYPGPEPTDEELAVQDADFQDFMEKRGLWNIFQDIAESFGKGFDDGKTLRNRDDSD